MTLRSLRGGPTGMPAFPPQRGSRAAPPAGAPCPQSQPQRGDVSRTFRCWNRHLADWEVVREPRTAWRGSGLEAERQAFAQQCGSHWPSSVRRVNADSPSLGSFGFLIPSLAGTAALGDVLPAQGGAPPSVCLEHSAETMADPGGCPWDCSPCRFPSTWDPTRLAGANLPHPCGMFAERGHLMTSSAFPGVWRAWNGTSKGPVGRGALDESGPSRMHLPDTQGTWSPHPRCGRQEGRGSHRPFLSHLCPSLLPPASSSSPLLGLLHPLLPWAQLPLWACSPAHCRGSSHGSAPSRVPPLEAGTLASPGSGSSPCS